MSDQNAPETNSDPEYTGLTISKRVDEVNLVFTVTNKRGRFVESLPASTFRLLDNNQIPPTLKYFQQQSGLPLRVALLIDLSDSIRQRFNFEQKAASVFLQHILRPGVDQAFVVGFDGSVRPVHDLSGDIRDLAKAIQQLKAGGDTAFYDAVIYASDKLRATAESRITRRAIIVISDGVDTASKAKLQAAEEAALRGELVIFALSTNSISEPRAKGNLVLRELTGLTGGHILPAHESEDLKSAFRQIEKALRSQYALGYQPSGFEPNGSFHSIQIIPRTQGLKVHCRKGYFASREKPSR